MLVLYLLLLCASSLAHVRPLPDLYDLEDAENIFEEFINKYNKAYASEQEKQEKFNIFKAHLETVNRLRLKQPQATFDVHEFSDLTEDEINSRNFEVNTKAITIEPETISVKKNLPDRFDWREHNAVTPIKDQGRACNSCWAFATTGIIEGAYAMKHKKLISFSEQQLVDCNTNNNGCNGTGYTYKALDYLQEVGGIETESDYPYKGVKDSRCEFNQSKVIAKVIGQKTIKLGNDDLTKQALIDYGPMSIGVWSRSAEFFNYNGDGIIKCPSGTKEDMDHVVILVGYGTENGVPYWIIKNSWGEKRGDKGYWRVQQGNNPCGMDYDDGLFVQIA